MKCQADPIDVMVYDAGSIIQFEPLTDAARDWFRAEVQSDPWQWLGNRLGVDARLAPGLAAAMDEHGLKWSVA